jgi:hypothetical protein
MALNNLSRTDLMNFLNVYNHVLNSIKYLDEEGIKPIGTNKLSLVYRFLRSASSSLKALEPRCK